MSTIVDEYPTIVLAVAASKDPVTVTEDPVTVVGLIYRIVDEPRRAFAFALILPVLAGWPAPAIWWSGTGVLGLSWLSRALVRLVRRKPSAVRGAGEAGHQDLSSLLVVAATKTDETSPILPSLRSAGRLRPDDEAQESPGAHPT
jgi:hypothetical protein